MANDIKYRDILYNNQQIGPFPSDRLKRVDEPTVNVHVGPHRRKPYSEGIGPRLFTGEYGEYAAKMSPVYTIREPLGAAFISVQKHLNQIRLNPVAPEKAPIPDDPRVLARHVKSLGYFLGADQVGICKVPEWGVLTHDPDGNEITKMYKYAIVLLVRKNASTTRVANGYEWIFDPCSFQAYQRLCTQTETMANYIRRLGHEAEASVMFKYQTIMMPFILMAGLGETSKSTSILNPFLGLNMKSAAVLTNLELEVDKPIDFGLQEYCASCNICVDACPSHAIYGYKTEFNGYETYKMEPATCKSFGVTNPRGCACGRCSKLCPWNFEELDNGELAAFWGEWDGTVKDMHARVRKHAKELQERKFIQKDERSDKWWFELCHTSLEDRTLRIPENSIPWDYEKYPVSTALDPPGRAEIYGPYYD